MATMTMAVSKEEPILSELDRLDSMLKHLEEVKGSNRSSSPQKSSYASTQSSGTLTTEAHASFMDDVSPKSLERNCCPINYVVLETEVKGTLIERLRQVEDRIIKLEAELVVEERHKETRLITRNPTRIKGLSKF